MQSKDYNMYYCLLNLKKICKPTRIIYMYGNICIHLYILVYKTKKKLFVVVFIINNS